MSLLRTLVCHLPVLSLGFSLGCQNDVTGGIIFTDPAHLYWQLTLNHHAITMALTPPYNTLRLVAMPQTATGAALIDSDRTTYAVSDTNVSIDSTGLLTAVAPDVGVKIIASQTIGTVTHTDSAVVNINAIPTPVPVFTTFVLTPQPGDSARSAVSWYDGPLFVYDSASLLDQDGQSIPNTQIFETSSDANILGMNGNFGTQYCSAGICLLQQIQPGHVIISAEATVYGVRKVTTLAYTVGWTLEQNVDVLPQSVAGHATPISYFRPGDDTVAAGAIIWWDSFLGVQPIDIVFDDSAAVQGVDSIAFDSLVSGGGFVLNSINSTGGNIQAFHDDSGFVGPYNGYLTGPQGTLCFPYACAPVGRARRFPTPGTYRYHSALTEAVGVIHVLPPFQVP